MSCDHRCLYPGSAKDCKPKSNSTIEEDGIPNSLLSVLPTIQGYLHASKTFRRCRLLGCCRQMLHHWISNEASTIASAKVA